VLPQARTGAARRSRASAGTPAPRGHTASDARTPATRRPRVRTCAQARQRQHDAARRTRPAGGPSSAGARPRRRARLRCGVAEHQHRPAHHAHAAVGPGLEVEAAAEARVELHAPVEVVQQAAGGARVGAARRAAALRARATAGYLGLESVPTLSCLALHSSGRLPGVWSHARRPCPPRLGVLPSLTACTAAGPGSSGRESLPAPGTKHSFM